MSTEQASAEAKTILVTGSADGLGKAAAAALQGDGHRVIVHVRSEARRSAVSALVDRGALVVVGDLADRERIASVAEQVNRLGHVDVVIHNAGVYSGPTLLAVNVVAPYVLTAKIRGPGRLVYLSSGMHRGGRPELSGLDWTGGRVTASYSDTKLFVTALAAAVARRWPNVIGSSVDPGWVPTKMGGPQAPDDLRLGHVTQAWLATSNDAEARRTGLYWHHQRPVKPHPAVHDEGFQDRLLEALALATGVAWPDAPPTA